MVRDKRMGQTARRAVTCALSITLSVGGTPVALAEALAETEQTAPEAEPAKDQNTTPVADEKKAGDATPANDTDAAKPTDTQAAPATEATQATETGATTTETPPAAPVADQVVNQGPHTDREVPFAASSTETSLSLWLRFYDTMPSVPYVGVSSFLEALWGKGTFTVERAADTLTVTPVSETASTVTINLTDATITSTLWGTDTVAGENGSETKGRTILFSTYGIAPTADEADVWLPLATLSDLFGTDAYGVIGFTGDELVRNDYFNETGNKAALEKLRAQGTRPVDMALFSVSELSLMLKSCLKPTAQSTFSHDVSEDGLAETLTKGEDPFGAAILVALNSDKVSDYLMGLKALEVLSAEDVTFDLGGDAELDKSLRAEATGLARKTPDSPLAQAYLKGKPATDTASAAAVKAARDKAFADGGTYHEAGSVALITLDTFDNGEGQVNPVLTEGLEKARNNASISYVVVDLTTNTSSSASLFDCLDAMTVAAETPRTVEAPAPEAKPDQEVTADQRTEEPAPEAKEATDAAAGEAKGAAETPAAEAKDATDKTATETAELTDKAAGDTADKTGEEGAVKAASTDIAIVAASVDTPWSKDPRDKASTDDAGSLDERKKSTTDDTGSIDERKKSTSGDEKWDPSMLDIRDGDWWPHRTKDVEDEGLWPLTDRDFANETWWLLRKRGYDDWRHWHRRYPHYYYDDSSSSSSDSSSDHTPAESPKPETAPATTETKPTDTPAPAPAPEPAPVTTPVQKAQNLHIAILTSAASSADANRLAELAHEKGYAVIGEPSAAVRRIMWPHLTAEGLCLMVNANTIDAGVAVDANLVSETDAGKDYTGLFDLQGLQATLESIRPQEPATTDEANDANQQEREKTDETVTPAPPADTATTDQTSPTDTTETPAPPQEATPALTRVDTQAATCTTAGHVTYWTDAAGRILKDEAGVLVGTAEEVAIDPIGHQWSEGQVTTEPTETTDGVITYACSLCHETKTEAIPATGKLAYYIKSGTNPTWTKGSLTPVSLTLAANQQNADPSAHIKGITLDGVALSEADFTHVDGMPAISLTATYLETLAKGNHTVQVTYDDVDATQTELVIRAQATEPVITSTTPATVATDYANTAPTSPLTVWESTSYDATAATAPAPALSTPVTTPVTSSFATTYDTSSFATTYSPITSSYSSFGEFGNTTIGPTAATGDPSGALQVVSEVAAGLSAAFIALSARIRKRGASDR